MVRQSTTRNQERIGRGRKDLTSRGISEMLMMIYPCSYSQRCGQIPPGTRPSARALKEHQWLLVPARQKNPQMFTALCVEGGTWSAFISFARSEQVGPRQDPANADRSQHSHPIFPVVTPPACHGLLFRRALLRHRTSPARCPTAHLCRCWLFRRSGLRQIWRSGRRGIPRSLDLSDGRKVRSLGVSLFRS